VFIMAFKIMNGLDLQSQKIVSLADGSSPTDAVTKQQLDSALSGLDWHTHVRAAASTSITISSPGATIDGVSMSSGERILLRAQSTGSQNGIWLWNGSSSALTRPADYTGVLTKPSTTVLVTEGSTDADKAYTLSTDGTVTVDTTATTWVQVGGGTTYVAGAGLTLTGSTFDVVAADGSITVNANDITVGNVTVAKGGTGSTTAAGARTNLGAIAKYAANITTVAATPLTVNHALGSTDVTVAVYDNQSGTGNMVIADIIQVDSNNITITTAGVLTGRIVVTG
jgi:hypothetical protein